MPIVTATQWVYNVINGMPLPGNTGPLQAFITPPNPEEDQLDPHAYVWPSAGSEGRESLPRSGVPVVGTTTSGWKADVHNIDIWISWFQDDSDPTPDLTFLTVVDDVMDALRTTQDPVMLTDPVTGRYSQIYATGERMGYDVSTVRGTTADQRVLRWDAKIAAQIKESFQA